ncbi:striatin-3-like [Culicoides brevitarsis]|uniref:striatin-3-like n=1 Tax=Culicoides brevitarsis TaxID=469753 RepID=UPI00307CA468
MRIIDSNKQIMNNNITNNNNNNMRMDEGGMNNNNGAGNANKGMMPGTEDQSNINANNVAQYTIPGVLHYLQHEWATFELERSQWDVDRAELQAKIAVLLGERKGQEALKADLIRRIKMLEYALKQERAKFHRLKYGCDPPNADLKLPPEDSTTTTIITDVAADAEVPFSAVSNITWRQGRQLLRQYLQEIGYTEQIIDVRSNRVRSLLGLNNNQDQEENVNPNVNGDTTHKRVFSANDRTEGGLGCSPAKKSQQTEIMEQMLLESEAAVLANFEFLAQADVEMSDDDDMGDDLNLGDTNKNESDTKTTKRKAKAMNDVDAEADEVLNELNLLGSDTNNENNRSNNNQNNEEWAGNTTNYGKALPRHIPGMPTSGDDEMDQSLGLGELAQLTVTNEAESTYDVGNAKEPYRKTWNAKYTLRSHFDCVRALAFHPEEPVLITGSEDHTLKLWNLQKTVPAKKSASLDVEPLYTFRGHTSPVLCLAMSTNGEQCYSGALDGTINCWNLPNPNIDPYDNYDSDVLSAPLESHTDAIWSLSVHHTKEVVVSASADETVKLWAPQELKPLLQTFESEDGAPTSVDFVRNELDKIVVSYQNSKCCVFDTETKKVVLRFEAAQDSSSSLSKYFYKVICHPTLPMMITAHEDRHIRFWDSNTGALVHAMVAHLDAVTSLAIDSHGLYLLSGSHDCSIRLWSIDNKTCVQEITAHRKKFDESILDVAFHPSKQYIASAGADAIAKVFV